MTEFQMWVDVKKSIKLGDGSILALVGRLGREREYGVLDCARNIFLVDAENRVIWQISSDFDSDGGSFTNIFLDGENPRAYRWDGGIYDIEMMTGKAFPILFAK